MKVQLEIFRFIIEERRRQKITREQFDKRSGTSAMSSLMEVARGNGITIGFLYVAKMLDALGYKIVIEDKDANWGVDERVRRLPKTLFLAERIESRDIIRKEGFHARVDLFENVDAVMNFYPKPFDVYEIRPGQLTRKHFDVIDHPYGTMYSYNQWISPDSINSRVTHR